MHDAIHTANESIFRCPRTSRALVRRGDAFETEDGAIRYPITRDVPDFRLSPPPDAMDEAELAELVRRAERDGWRAAVAAVRPQMMAYVDDPSRAMFLDCVPLTRDMRVLEIGCSLGQILCALAPRVREVYAVELSPGQAQFAALRCREEGCTNVHVAAGGDDLLLPFADGAFDAVILNHVFEWVHVGAEREVTSDAQRLLLREMRRVLKPGGVLFLSTKNRFGLRLLLGGRDENARDIRFGNALPRKLSRVAAARRPGLLGLLHSYPKLERMLRESGFEPLQSFWGAPDGRYPKRYVPTDPASVRAARRTPELARAQGTTRATRMLMPLVPAPLVKFVAPGLTFVARAKQIETRL